MLPEVNVVHTCNGTATSNEINAMTPEHELFVATALDDLPTLASTMYAREVKYIHLRPS